MRHQIAVIVLILAAAVATNAADLKCDAVAKLPHDFYVPTGTCANDTEVKACLTTYDTCAAGAATCTDGFKCVSEKLRCLESITTAGADCAAWIAMLSNEKLYIAAGGEYNRSTLEMSCQNAVCRYLNTSKKTCTADTYAKVCVDPFSVAPLPPPGAVTVVFTISGDAEKFRKMLSTESGRRQAFGVVARLLLAILKISDSSKLVIVDIRVGSLIVEFYTTDPSLSASSVQTLLNGVNALPNKAELFGELATLSGIPASELGVTGVDVSTTAPLVPPTPTAASLATVAAAVAAALLALLL